MPRMQFRRAGVALGAAMLIAGAACTPASGEDDCNAIARNYALLGPDADTIQTNSALFAAADSSCEDFASKLIAAGASLVARDSHGAMPLAHAAREGRVKLVELFLAHGAPIDARDVDGGTALYAAAEHEKPTTVSVLLAKGANPNLAGHFGLTPLIAAAFAGNDRIVEDLIAHGADPQARDATGKSAIAYAAARGFDDIVGRLLDAGVDARQRYGHGLTALMWAAGHDQGVGVAAIERVADLLLAHGAAIDAADDRGRTALMIAAGLGDAAVVDLLIRRGADRAHKDKDGKTALDLAANDAVRDKLAAK